MNRQTQYLKSNSITLVFYDSLDGKTNCRNTAVFFFVFLHAETCTAYVFSLYVEVNSVISK